MRGLRILTCLVMVSGILSAGCQAPESSKGMQEGKRPLAAGTLSADAVVRVFTEKGEPYLTYHHFRINPGQGIRVEAVEPGGTVTWSLQGSAFTFSGTKGVPAVTDRAYDRAILTLTDASFFLAAIPEPGQNWTTVNEKFEGQWYRKLTIGPGGSAGSAWSKLRRDWCEINIYFDLQTWESDFITLRDLKTGRTLRCDRYNFRWIEGLPNRAATKLDFYQILDRFEQKILTQVEFSRIAAGSAK